MCTKVLRHTRGWWLLATERAVIVQPEGTVPLGGVKSLSNNP